jgi:FKBP-type peptidyl-prolyl cis-trans isomerase (trigger factor)
MKIGHAFEVSIVEVESLKTITMISAEASTAHQEQVMRNSTREVKFQMLLEFQARNKHVKVTQGNANQLIYSWVRNERQLYKKDPHSYDPLYCKRLT